MISPCIYTCISRSFFPILCLHFPFLAVLSSNGQTQQSQWFIFTSCWGKRMIAESYRRGEKKAGAKSWCTDLIWMQILTCEGSCQSWERALSSLQSPKIIVLCGAWELTALAFMLTVLFSPLNMSVQSYRVSASQAVNSEWYELRQMVI